MDVEIWNCTDGDRVELCEQLDGSWYGIAANGWDFHYATKKEAADMLTRNGFSFTGIEVQ